LLIRDAAYDSLPKSVRAELHERFADWLVSHTELVELDEIVGYHLEQAVGYRRELGKPVEELAERAAERLAASGRRALWREDRRAARALFERALELTRPFRLDVLLEVDLAATLFIEDSRRAAEIVEAAAEQAGVGAREARGPATDGSLLDRACTRSRADSGGRGVGAARRAAARDALAVLAVHAGLAPGDARPLRRSRPARPGFERAPARAR